MTRKILLVPILAFAFAAGACEQRDGHEGAAAGNAAMNPSADADAVAAVKAAEQDMLEAYQAKDAAALKSHYAADAVLAVPERTSKGSEAVGKAIDEDLGDPAFKLDFTNEKTDVSGDLAYTTGSFTVTYTDGETKKPTDGAGTYVTVFKKQADGSWKVVADVATPTGG